jgi:exopolysaccharide biosynthesis WecB/TagA/CpsF family protein
MENKPSATYEIIIEKIGAFGINEGLTSFVNPYSMLQLSDKHEVINDIDYWCADGISLVKLVKLFYGKNISRYSFDDASMAPMLFDYVKNNNLTLAIIGTKADIIDLAIRNIEYKYGVKVTYFRNGYFTCEELKQTIDTIINNDIKVIICGMGTPLQEEFLIKLKQAGWRGYGYSCGGYLHQMAKSQNYYPDFFSKYNLRWAYRIYDEPKLVSRYIVKYPAFMFKLLAIRLKK